LGFFDDVVDFVSDPVNIVTGGISGPTTAVLGGGESLIDTLSPEINVPGPTPEEQELTGITLDAAKRAQLEQELLRPFLLRELGLKEVDGEFIKLTEEERLAGLTPEQRSSLDIQREFQARQLKALRGELDVPAFIQRDIEERKKELAQSIAERGQAGGTAQAQREGEFDRVRLGLLDHIRRGEISTNEAALQSRFGLLPSVSQQKVSNFANLPGSTAGLISGVSGAFDPLKFNRSILAQTAFQNAANRQQLMSDLLGTAGNVGAAFLGG